MRKRVVVTLAVLAALLVGGYVVFDAFDRRPGVTRRNFEAIRTGMSVAEVQALLGSTRNKVLAKFCSPPRCVVSFEGDGGVVTVLLGDGGTVQDKGCTFPEGFLERVRRALGL